MLVRDYIAILLGVLIGGALVVFTHNAKAQTVVTAYEGCTFAWTYSATEANHAGFRMTIDGVTGSTSFGKAIRSAKCADTILAGKPFGPYTVKLVATAVSPATNSAPAVLKIDYKARPVLAPPTTFTVE